jgi:Carbohydrate-selective porin, OprB family/S-layer homology domain
MSKTLWNALRISSAVLGTAILVANGAAAIGAETPATKSSPEASTVDLPSGTLAENKQVDQPPEVNNSAIAQSRRANISLIPANSTAQAQVPLSETAQPATSIEQLNQYTGELNPKTQDNMSQVTSVSQLTDVDPTHWAFQALQSLVERYGCIEGYPDRTYRGNRALTRYEFAAGLNSCLDRIQELIAAAVGDLPSKEDIATIRRLQEEFAAELATLRGRVDALEARTAELEANQFSTTTKLSGEAIFAVADAFGDDVGDQVNTVMHDRVRLNLLTSFTGKDRLFTRLQVGNAIPLLGRAVLNDGTIGTQEGRFTYDGPTDNDVVLDRLDYRFPIGKQATVTLFAANGLTQYYADTVNPFFEGFGGGSNAISRFGERNPIYRIGPLGAGIGFNYQFNKNVRLDLGYLANEANDPSSGDGLFKGNYSALAQLVFGTRYKIGLTYIHAYDGSDSTRFTFGGTGTSLANLSPAALVRATTLGRDAVTTPVATNSYGIEISLKFSPRFVVNGWVGKTDARLIGLGDADIWNYALGFAFPDFGKKGNLLGLLAGAEPYLTDLDVPGSENFSDDIPFHLEGFYKFQVTNNISVTPGVIWLLAPNQNNDNSDVIIGTIRTTFTF